MPDVNRPKIPKYKLQRLIDQLPLIGCNVCGRELDAELFQLIDSRSVRKLTVVFSEDHLVDTMDEVYLEHPAVKALSPVANEDWLSETVRLTADCCPDDCGHCGCRVGYPDLEWEFAERPIYTRVPPFTSSVESALMLKSRLLEGCVRIAELHTDVGPVYEVTTSAGQAAAATYKSMELACAILGATLSALISQPKADQQLQGRRDRDV